MSIESKLDVLAAAINRLADALTSKTEVRPAAPVAPTASQTDRKSTRLNSSHT